MYLSTRTAVLGVISMLLAGTAFGQLSSEDIAALRLKGELEGWTFTVGESEATGYALHELCGLADPAESRARGVVDPGHVRGPLPDAFDWRDYGGCTPVRNQAGCGSCWAFGAVGIVESAILRTTGVSADLAEQWLVSCTNSGTCSGGWHDEALMYMLHMGALDYCNDYGAVPEVEFPYQAYDAPCGDCPYSRPYAIESWAFVSSGMPTPEQIKQAILDHGPVAVTVYVNSAFHAYDSGVFNACETSAPNHVVNLVGWDDNQGTAGVWIMRNSWSPGWGEDGYMRIQYNCSGIGDNAVYVEYPPDCNVNGQYDFCDLDCDAGHCATSCGQSADCNLNVVPDECEPDEDCNSNGVQDICDIAAGICEDCNGNYTCDQCEPDCDGSGVPDDCEMNTDCNNNGVQDICDLAAGTSADCNGNNWPDECDLFGISSASGELSPIGRFLPQQYTVPSAPPALGDVTLSFTAIADLNLCLQEWVDVDINGVAMGAVFQGIVHDCPTTPSSDELVISAEAFNAAVNGGDAVINMVATDAVDAWQCEPYSFITVAVEYAVAEDCTGNGILDACEPDCNENGAADSCDILNGVSIDADGDGIPDECDNCDLYNPDQLDCQPNGAGDPCDVAYGSSPDVNADGIPDECDPLQPGPESGGDACGVPVECTGAYAGADCVGGACYIPKNRYLSIDPSVNEDPVAYQVEIVAAPNYPEALGRTWWAGEPVCYDYPNGDPVLPAPPTCEGLDRFGWVSQLTDTPVTRVWVETPLHVTGCGIVPVVTYHISAWAEGGVAFSPTGLTISTAHNPDGEAQSWGDITGGPVPGRPPLWLPPEGAANFGDVGNAIRTFENCTEATGAPPYLWVDVEINRVINLGDIQFIIKAFEGMAYADLADLEFIGVNPADCP